jgi:hypothetical protein
MSDYHQRREQTRRVAEDYAHRANCGETEVVYRFGESLIDEDGISISSDGVHMPGYKQDVVFDKTNPWKDMS